jgi:hypothetical protein
MNRQLGAVQHDRMRDTRGQFVHGTRVRQELVRVTWGLCTRLVQGSASTACVEPAM